MVKAVDEGDGPEYRDVFIAVAGDCPVDEAQVPEPFRGKATVATIQHGLLAADPYALRQSDVLFLTHALRRGVDPDESPDAAAALRAELFSKPQPCLRASPLPKKYGWGIHFDGEGRAALVGLGTPRYDQLAAGDGGGAVVTAMRSARG